jgi:hypothetical protein
MKYREALDKVKNKEMLDLLHFDNFTFSEDDPIIASPFRDNSKILNIIPIYRYQQEEDGVLKNEKNDF